MMKILLTTAVAAMALASVGVSSASASVAKPSSSTVKLTTTGVTLSKEGAEAKTCTAKPIELLWSGNSFFGGNGAFGRTEFTCDGGSLLYMRLSGSSFYDEVGTKGYFLQIASWNEAFPSPYGSYFQSSQNWIWVNGSEATPSTVNLNEVVIGLTGGKKITMSGTFTAKSGSGGLVTMSH